MATARPFSRTLRHLLFGLGALTIVLPATPVLAGPSEWFGTATTKGSGTLVKENRALDHFDGIALGMAGSVELRMGDSESISVESDDNLLPLIETVIENGTLRIRPSQKNARLAPTRLRFVVQAKNIERLSVGGSGSIRADRLRTSRLKTDIGGSGSVDIAQLQSELVTVGIGGSGNFRAAGSSTQMTVAIGGSGQASAERLASDDVRISIGGSGQAAVWAKRSLQVSIGGSGDVDYYGDPQISRSVAGSGRIKRLGSAP